MPIDGSTKGSNKNGGTHSDSLTEKENESISEEVKRKFDVCIFDLKRLV